MAEFVAYIRVSTAKQGEQGVSLQQQRDIITRFAQERGLAIQAWFEERQTAAKANRPIFHQMLQLLRKGEAQGLIVHKIDRGARNLRDWADLGDLIDAGVKVYFAGDSLDLDSRGGRLSADIQAVVAADYIRNLREETRKGFYGRLKQGIYCLPAPVGYVNCGKGKPKEPDPIQGPLVRQTFELYAAGRIGINELVKEMYRRGLRNHRGGRVTRTGMSVVLNNVFYTGLIHLRRTGERFKGIHQPLISTTLFERCQRVLRGKTNSRSFRHDFLFRRLLTCRQCGYSLIGERQKGHVYYRCHTAGCPTKAIREEAVTASVSEAFAPLLFCEHELEHFRAILGDLKRDWAQKQTVQREALTLRQGQVKDRLNRLTDALLDGLIDRQAFEQRKSSLITEQTEIEAGLRAMEAGLDPVTDRVAEFLELAGNVALLYETAIDEEKRDLLEIVTSNRTVDGKNVVVELSEPFQTVANDYNCSNSALKPTRPRTGDRLVNRLWKWFMLHPEATFPRPGSE